MSGLPIFLVIGAAMAQRGTAGYVPQVNAGERDLREHRYSSAASHFRYALQWNSTGTAAHDGLGNVYLKIGRKQRALEEFSAALSQNPHDDSAERGMHDARSDGQEEESFQALEELVHREPKNADVRTTYAEALVDRDRLDEAKQAATAALALDDKQWHAHCALGRVALAKGNLSDAKPHLLIATSHDDSDDDALSALGDIAMKEGRAKDAVKYYRQVVKIVPEEADSHRNLAGALDAIGDKAGAEKERLAADAIEKRIKPEHGGAPLRFWQQPAPAKTAQTPAAQAPATPAGQAPAQQGADAPDTHPPAVSGGTPTITDAATLSAPGWLEVDPGVLKDLERDNLVGSPFTLKYTTLNNRLQYLLGSNGYTRFNNHDVGIGDTFPGIHYLFLNQEKFGFDVALKGILKVPTASSNIGGTLRPDYSGFVLASRDFTKWGFHGDFNGGLSSLSRAGAPGYDTQAMVSGSTTSPLQGGRWIYTNELVYFSPIEGQEYQLTAMHGFSYVIHRYEILSAALQIAYHGDIPRYQLLFAMSFNVNLGGKK